MALEQIILLDRARQAAKERYLSRKTENAYVNHIRRFLLFYEDADLSVDRAGKIGAFLRHLQKNERLGASTRNQARCALMFFYREVLRQQLSERFDRIKRAPLPTAQTIVFTAEEARAVLANLRDAPFLIAALMYGSGLRLSEAVALRIGDIDFERGKITVRDAISGKKDRATILPRTLVPALHRHLIKVEFTYEDDQLSGFGRVRPPEDSLRRNGKNAALEWRGQYVFPAAKLTQEGKAFYRHHIAESTVQKAVAEAVEKAKIFKPSGCQTFRYSFAARLFEKNCTARTIQNLLGHKNLKTTMHCLNLNIPEASDVFSPLDV